MASSRASGKLILLGEHAVVYGHPALAIPFEAVELEVTVRQGTGGWSFPGLDEHRPVLEELVVQVAHELGTGGVEGLELHVTSTIPLGCGLGSSAALSVALTSALARLWGRPLETATLNRIAYRLEETFHGTPSGVDNTVIAYRQPVCFRPGDEPHLLQVGAPYHLVVADSGQPSDTRAVVEAVRALREARPDVVNAALEAIGQLVEEARRVLLAPTPQLLELARLLEENQRQLQGLTVSSPRLEELLGAARAAGALGAKLTGAGRGGNLLALVPDPPTAERVGTALDRAGAARTWRTVLASSRPGN